MRRAIRQLLRKNSGLFYCAQNVVELWSVMTRPADRNGFGLSIRETEEEVLLIERASTLLPDNAQIHPLWRRMVNDHGVHGRQVHDARLVAAMHVHGLSNLLTLESNRFSSVRRHHRRRSAGSHLEVTQVVNQISGF